MLSVVALGVFMGKQMFKMMEAESTSGNKSQKSNINSTATTTVKVLYSSANSKIQVPKPKVTPIPETVIPANQITETANNNVKKPNASKNSFKFVPGGPKWYAYASAKGVNVRKGPSTKYKKLFKVAKGTRGTVLKQQHNWTKIKWDFNRKIGWVRNDLLLLGPANVLVSLVNKTSDIDNISKQEIKDKNIKQVLKENKIAVAIAKPAPVATTVKGYVKGSKLPEYGKIIANPAANIRSGPDTRNAKIGKLPTGITVKIKSVKQTGKWQWFEIIFNNGRKTGWTREDNISF